MENLIVAFNCVLPSFLIISLGAVIRHSKIVPEETFNHITKIAFHYLLPFLLFHNIYSTDLNTAVDAKLLSFLFLYVLIWFIIGFVVTKFVVPDRRQRGAYVQCFFRANIAIVGISMADTMMGAPGVAAMAMAIAVLVPLYNVLAVILLEVLRGGQVELKPTLISILKNPLILGCAVGILFLLTGLEVPASVLKAVGQVGTAGSVMTMLALGASFQLGGVRKNLRKVIIADFIKLILTPAIALILAVLLGFRGNDLCVILLCTAPSLATTAYTMAIARDSDHELTGQIVVTTSFFCCITLFIWIFVLKQIGLI
ncbi:MAG: AEC family transporter [Eubacteriales bacterium]|nr:AEC family transporter [Eubacteriales bacterium]